MDNLKSNQVEPVIHCDFLDFQLMENSRASVTTAIPRSESVRELMQPWPQLNGPTGSVTNSCTNEMLDLVEFVQNLVTLPTGMWRRRPPRSCKRNDAAWTYHRSGGI